MTAQKPYLKGPDEQISTSKRNGGGKQESWNGTGQSLAGGMHKAVAVAAVQKNTREYD